MQQVSPVPSVTDKVTRIMTGLKGQGDGFRYEQVGVAAKAKALQRCVYLVLPRARTHFSRIVRASISAFSSPGTSNLLVSVRDTSVLASASLLGSFKLPALSPTVWGE